MKIETIIGLIIMGLFGLFGCNSDGKSNSKYGIETEMQSLSKSSNSRKIYKKLTVEIINET